MQNPQPRAGLEKTPDASPPIGIGWYIPASELPLCPPTQARPHPTPGSSALSSLGTSASESHTAAEKQRRLSPPREAAAEERKATEGVSLASKSLP